jgi:hypothetical protein
MDDPEQETIVLNEATQVTLAEERDTEMAAQNAKLAQELAKYIEHNNMIRDQLQVTFSLTQYLLHYF